MLSAEDLLFGFGNGVSVERFHTFEDSLCYSLVKDGRTTIFYLDGLLKEPRLVYETTSFVDFLGFYDSLNILIVLKNSYELRSFVLWSASCGDLHEIFLSEDARPAFIDKGWLYYTVYKSDAIGIWRYGLTTREKVFLIPFERGQVVQPIAISPDERTLIIAVIESHVIAHALLVDIESLEKITVDSIVNLRSGCFRDDDFGYFAGWKIGSDRSGLYSFNRDGRLNLEYYSDREDVVAVGVFDGFTYILCSNGTERPLKRMAGKKPVLLMEGEVEEIQSLNGLLLAKASTYNSGMSIVRVENGLPWNAYLSDRLIQFSDIPEPMIMTSMSKDGTKVDSLLYRSDDPQARNRPTIVWCHDGPHVSNRKSFSLTINLIVSMGFDVIAPNFRGSSGYGIRFMEQSWGMEAIDDVEGAILSYFAGAAPRVITMGVSYGGYMSLLLNAILPPGMVAGTISIFGPTHVNEMVECSKEPRRTILSRIIDPQKTPSPHCYAEQMQGEILMIYGDEDPRIPYDYAKEFSENVSLVGNAKVDFVTLAKVGHGIGNVDRTLIFEKCESFLSSYTLIEQDLY